jgi:hypothetical protein
MRSVSYVVGVDRASRLAGLNERGVEEAGVMQEDDSSKFLRFL